MGGSNARADFIASTLEEEPTTRASAAESSEAVSSVLAPMPAPIEQEMPPMPMPMHMPWMPIPVHMPSSGPMPLQAPAPWMLHMPPGVQGTMLFPQNPTPGRQPDAPKDISEVASCLTADIAAGNPSIGSALHGTGRCQPCAWFWKPGRGCQDGARCDHCHLCPEGELKARKKAKVAALRAGMAMPGNPAHKL